MKVVEETRFSELSLLPKKKLKNIEIKFSAGAVRARIIRAFLIEEQKIVVKVLKAKQQAQAAAK